MLLAIDVFSGIGGISLALKNFVKTIQYCEIDSYCQCVLVDRMKEGLLDKASIHSNIRTLHVSESLAPNIIVGGFPCQDVSCIGLQKGVADGERSGLFYEIIRLVDECPTIKYVFLENVANILNCGLQEVLEEFKKRDFELQWLVRSANALGAPHVRARWFCLAVKQNYSNEEEIDAILNAQTDRQSFDWSIAPSEAHITFKPHVKEDPSYDSNWIQRCQCLGNSVVPDVVRGAFIELCTLHKNRKQLYDCLNTYAQSSSTMMYPYPEACVLYTNLGQYIELPKSKAFAPNNIASLDIVVDDKKVTLNNLPTPRRGVTHASTSTERSIRDLPSVLVNNLQTKEYVKNIFPSMRDEDIHSSVVPNVHYIEWMMGFPKDWTKTVDYVKKRKQNTVITTNIIDDGVNDDVVVSDTNKSEKVKSKRTGRNGMHIFMREHPGKDVKAISTLWRNLPIEDKNKCSQQAKKECQIHKDNIRIQCVEAMENEQQ